MRVLLGVVAPEALQVDQQDWRHIVNLNLLHRLLMGDTLVAIPGVCLGQVLRFVELTETVLNAHIFRWFIYVAAARKL